MSDHLRPDGKGGFDIVDANDHGERLVAGLIAAALLSTGIYHVIGGLGTPIQKVLFLVSLLGGYFLGWQFHRLVNGLFWLAVLAVIALIVGVWVIS